MTSALVTPPDRVGRRPAGGRVVVLAVLALLAALTVSIATMSPAAAHDRLTGSEPADGETVPAPPEALVLTFSAEVLDISPRVQVTAEGGQVITEGAPTVDGDTATLPLPDDLAPGAYEAAWRVVSSDGHPIEGVVAFTVEDSAPAETDAVGSESVPDPRVLESVPAPAETLAETDPATDPVAEENAADETEQTATGSSWIIVVFAAATAALVAVVVLRSRRRRG